MLLNYERKINLSKKTIPKARKALKRLVVKRNKKFPYFGFDFTLPKYKPIIGSRLASAAINISCPYCGSPLVETEGGIVCSGVNLKKIAFDIYETVRKWGPKADLFLSIKANRFFDLWLILGRDLTCDYVVGEENRWRINNRLLGPGVDRKKIFSSKKR